MAKQKDYREVLTTPFETGIKNFTSVAKYFLYYSPCIDSAQSQGELDEKQSDEVYERMLASTQLKSKTRVLKKIQKTSWKISSLDGFCLDFEDSRMMFDQYSKETELHALLRHIRNAMAHGYLYVWRKKGKGDYVLLVDYDSGKRKETAKILVTMKILEQWKAILENTIAIGE